MGRRSSCIRPGPNDVAVGLPDARTAIAALTAEPAATGEAAALPAAASATDELALPKASAVRLSAAAAAAAPGDLLAAAAVGLPSVAATAELEGAAVDEEAELREVVVALELTAATAAAASARAGPTTAATGFGPKGKALDTAATVFGLRSAAAAC